MNMLESLRHVSVSMDKKSITYRNPFLKNKKGHPAQQNRGVTSLNDEELNKLCRDLDSILTQCEEEAPLSYNAFLKIMNQYPDSKAFEYVFKGTPYMNEYDEKLIDNILEQKVPISSQKQNVRYCDPVNVFFGLSGAGKTTFMRQWIGSIETNFPATDQANTTIGSTIVHLKNEADRLTACVVLMKPADLRERLSMLCIPVVHWILNHQEAFNGDDLIDFIYEELSTPSDCKIKLDFLVSEDNIKSQSDLPDIFLQVSQAMWADFRKAVSKSHSILVNEKFSANNEKIRREFDEFLDEHLSSSNAIGSLLSIVKHAAVQTIRNIQMQANEFCQDSGVSYCLEAIDTQNIHTWSESTNLDDQKLDYPQVLNLQLYYKDSHRPDVTLRKQFFALMEHISSALGETPSLFPLVRQMRICGNFRPIWIDDSTALGNHILIDSEGVAHDLANSSISLELRTLLSYADKITLIQNGSAAASTELSNIFSTLIHNSWLHKTNFVFNRMELISRPNSEKKVNFIIGSVKNALSGAEKLDSEKNLHIISGNEELYKDIIISNSFYCENLPQVYTSTNAQTEFSIVSIINKQLKTIFLPQKYTPQEFQLLPIKPQYCPGKLISILQYLSNQFYKHFEKNVVTNPWQTVKAFNARIAGDWNKREWGPFTPESDLVGTMSSCILSYLLNPENIQEMKHYGNTYTDFAGMVHQFLSNQKLNIQLQKISEQVVYQDLLDSCWILGISYSGLGSTKMRERTILSEMKAKFYSEYACVNVLYKDIQKLISESPFCIYKPI